MKEVTISFKYEATLVALRLKDHVRYLYHCVEDSKNSQSSDCCMFYLHLEIMHMIIVLRGKSWFQEMNLQKN